MAEIKPSYDTNRQKLADIIPLEAPFGMYIEPTRKCNFKCFYCMHSTRNIVGGELEQTGFAIENMSDELYDKLVADIMSMPELPKRICFSGLGDPLMNPKIPEMVKKLRDVGFKGRVDLLTNGALLTPRISDALIAAGLSRIQISIQGLDSQAYQEVCGVPVDISRLVENLKYFYEHKQDTTIFIKIIDSLLKNKAEEEKFFAIFSSICDTIFIEHLVIMQQQMGDHGGKVDATKNLNGEEVAPRLVCGVMFYFLQVNIDGETFPCSTPGLPNSFSMGNAYQKTLSEIWQDLPRNQLMRTNLIDGYRKIPTCSTCSSVICIAQDEEYLDDCRLELVKKLPQLEV